LANYFIILCEFSVVWMTSFPGLNYTAYCYHNFLWC